MHVTTLLVNVVAWNSHKPYCVNRDFLFAVSNAEKCQYGGVHGQKCFLLKNLILLAITVFLCRENIVESFNQRH
jgi:hypothetical protein